MDFDYSKYRFTEQWFHPNVALRTELYKYLDPNKELNILEIGNFEGLSSCFLSDNYLNHNDSMLHCVDPFFISGTVEGITSKCITEETEKMFLENIAKSKNYKKIIVNKKTSDDFFKNNNVLYDLIYVDGNHEKEYIKRDIINSFSHIKKGGIIWFDDYGGHTKNHFDSVLKDFKYETLYSRYQLGIRVPN